MDNPPHEGAAGNESTQNQEEHQDFHVVDESGAVIPDLDAAANQPAPEYEATESIGTGTHGQIADPAAYDAMIQETANAEFHVVDEHGNVVPDLGPPADFSSWAEHPRTTTPPSEPSPTHEDTHQGNEIPSQPADHVDASQEEESSSGCTIS